MFLLPLCKFYSLPPPPIAIDLQRSIKTSLNCIALSLQQINELVQHRCLACYNFNFHCSIHDWIGDSIKIGSDAVVKCVLFHLFRSLSSFRSLFSLAFKTSFQLNMCVAMVTKCVFLYDFSSFDVCHQWMQKSTTGPIHNLFPIWIVMVGLLVAICSMPWLILLDCLFCLVNLVTHLWICCRVVRSNSTVIDKAFGTVATKYGQLFLCYFNLGIADSDLREVTKLSY